MIYMCASYKKEHKMPITTVTKTQEHIILVNPKDERIGVIEKILAHEYGMLHRAFSVLIFRTKNGKLQSLLQQRSKKKYHGGGLWTNTCCSHPHPNEKILPSAKKRLKDEMGIETKLKEIGKFHYVAPFANGLTENEIDHVLIGFYAEDKIPFNRREVENYKWINVSALQKELVKNPKKYTPWFKQALDLALKSIHKLDKKKFKQAK